MTITAVPPRSTVESDPFLLETVATDSMIISVEATGPVALTCNCYGSCGPGLCGSCCSMTVTALEI